jgi:hypothetical protein
MSFIAFLCDESPENYFDKHLKTCKDLERLPKELRKCNCCYRHKKFFPILGGKALPKFNKDKERIENECKCPCRHIARHICREWETLNEVEDIEESSEESDDSDEDYIPPLDDFIVPDEGLKRKERQELNRVLRKLRRN